MNRRGKGRSCAVAPSQGSIALFQRDDAVETLITRARKSRLKGDTRRALVLLREACALDEWRARTWTILGALHADLGRRNEAEQAFRQARWLRVRAGERARAAVLDRLIQRIAAAAA